MTSTRIIARLWSHIFDLLMYVKGQSKKSIEQIESEVGSTEHCCEQLLIWRNDSEEGGAC